jgi:cytochrome c-type biogenesis protein CcmH
MRRIVAATLLFSLAALSGTALAAAPQTSLSDVEDEVMCPICGTLLELSNSPQAAGEKAFIAKLIAAGKTKQEIKDALVAQYGQEALAVPQGSGFDLSAYLVPLIGLLAAVVALAIGIRRWRRHPRPSETSPASGGSLNKEDAERLDADLERYDL